MTKNELLQHENLIMFKQHGFKPENTSGTTQVIGECVFCGGSKFHINPEKKMWDCKTCGKEGGFQTFLKAVYESASEDIIELANNRGIQESTLSYFGIRYNEGIDRYYYPHFSPDNKALLDLQLYDGKALHSSATCSPSLFNIHAALDNRYDTVYLCEGGWDTPVMHEIIQGLGLERTIALGVPGALTFKIEWIPFFKDKKVIVIYDADHKRELTSGKIEDGAGTKGMNKVYRILLSCVKDLSFIHWPEGLKNGYDLRDLYKEKNFSARRTMLYVKRLLMSLPPEFKEDEKTVAAKEKSKFTGEGCSAEEVKAVFDKWLEAIDKNVLDIVFGTIIANREEGDPVWLFLVGDSGDGKSEIIMSLNNAKGIYSTTSLTSHSLVSGFGTATSADPSLIPRLVDKTLVVKDFTVLLTTNPTERDAVFGILRDVYDGKTEKIFGNGICRSYEGHFGLIAGVTHVIEQFTEGHTSLGERFLRWSIVSGTTDEIENARCRKVMDNSEKKIQMRKELAVISEKCLDYDFLQINPTVPFDISEKIIALARFTAMVRGTVTRAIYGNEITHKAMCEKPMRMTGQFTKLIRNIARFHRLPVVTDELFNILKHIALSTMPSRLEEIVHKIYKHPIQEMNCKDLTASIRLPQVTIERMVENLCMLGVLYKNKIGEGLTAKTTYKFTETSIKLMERCSLYETKKKRG